MEDKLNAKAINSAKWLVIISIFSSCSSIITTTVLGRISSSLLGKYSLVISFLNLTTTVVCMGGSVFLSRYIIRAEDVVTRSRIFFTYIYLVIFIYVLFAMALFLSPDIYNMFVGSKDGSIKIFSIFIMMPIYASVTVVSYLLIALLESKISKIMGCMYAVGMSCVCVGFYCINPTMLEEHIYIVAFATILCMNLLALVIGIVYIKRNHLLCVTLESTKPLIYKGEFVFIFCTLGQAVLVYLYGNFDKVVLSQLSGVGQLGVYQAMLQIVAVVEMIPNLLGNVTIPYFSSIVGTMDADGVRKIYRKIERLFILCLATVVFTMIAFSDLILNLFGGEYIMYKDALIMMLAGTLLSSRGFLNTPMMVNMDKHMWRLINSVLQVSIQVLLILLFVKKIGLYGAVLAKTGCTILAQVLPQYIINKSQYHIGYSRQYIVAAICICALCLCVLIFKPGMIISIFLSALFYTLFFVGARYSFRNVLDDAKRFLRNKQGE